MKLSFASLKFTLGHGLRLVGLASAAIALAGAAGCTQGRGQRCQVDDDCEDGLTCSQAEPKTCGGAEETQIDACIPAQDPNGCVPNPVDAGIDAPPPT